MIYDVSKITYIGTCVLDGFAKSLSRDQWYTDSGTTQVAMLAITRKVRFRTKHCDWENRGRSVGGYGAGARLTATRKCPQCRDSWAELF